MINPIVENESASGIDQLIAAPMAAGSVDACRAGRKFHRFKTGEKLISEAAWTDARRTGARGIEQASDGRLVIFLTFRNPFFGFKESDSSSRKKPDLRLRPSPRPTPPRPGVFDLPRWYTPVGLVSQRTGFKETMLSAKKRSSPISGAIFKSDMTGSQSRAGFYRPVRYRES